MNAGGGGCVLDGPATRPGSVVRGVDVVAGTGMCDDGKR